MPIAQRVLKIIRGSAVEELRVLMGQVQAGPDGGWFCTYSIDWPGDPRQGEAWGVDAFQALSLTLERIGLDLYTSPYHRAGELVWERRGDGYGFPLPINVRHLAVGADRPSGE